MRPEAQVRGRVRPASRERDLSRSWGSCVWDGGRAVWLQVGETKLAGLNNDSSLPRPAGECPLEDMEHRSLRQATGSVGGGGVGPPSCLVST